MLGYNTQIHEYPTGTLNTTKYNNTNYHMPVSYTHLTLPTILLV